MNIKGLIQPSPKQVTHFPNPPTTSAHPTFGIYTPPPRPQLWPQPQSTIENVKGLSELYAAITGEPAPARVSYRDFEVYRDGEDMGNLWDMRQALQVWLIEKSAWDGGRRRQ